MDAYNIYINIPATKLPLNTQYESIVYPFAMDTSVFNYGFEIIEDFTTKRIQVTGREFIYVVLY